VLFPLLDLLIRFLPLVVALPIGLAVTLGVAELAHRFVELPARRIVRLGRSRAQSINS
jgi:peptidoglycan/LPS O-acetylase OafA/YrhL